MPKHKETGIKGEQIAENFLLKKGYKILHKNWRFEKKEVDIIAEENGLLIFIEVKTRSYYGFGFPEDAVSNKKQEFMKLSAEEYTSLHKEYTDVRFDIISILLKGDEATEIVHITDAFY